MVHGMGKSYAVNPFVWFCNAKVLSVSMPRRRVLRYNKLMLSCMLMSVTCVYGYDNSWTENSAVRTLENGSKQPVPITWYVTGDLDEIGDPRGTDLSGKTPDTFRNIHITEITYDSDAAPFDISIPWHATWLSGGSADTTYPAIDQIDATAFRGCDAILSVTIPVARQAGIAKIGMPCFLGCQNLTAIRSNGRDGDLEWSKSMCHYHTENGVLYDNTRTSLKKYPEGRQEEVFTVPPSVTSLEDYCFANTRFLKSLVFTGQVPAVGEHTFANSSVRTVYYIRQSEEDNSRWEEFAEEHLSEFRARMLDGISDTEFSLTIQNGVVTGVNGVYPKHIKIPSGVTRIGNAAFQFCTGLESVTIPDGVTSIGIDAFCGSGLTSVTIPDGVTSIEAGTFKDCSDLVSVTIPASVTNMGNWVFADCYSLERITIPSSVKTIGESAFRNCTALESITIPSDVTEIGEMAFKGCYKLADANGYVIVRNILYDYVHWYASSATVPDGVTDISERAFRGCYIDKVTMPDSLRRIGSEAFYKCQFLADVTIPGSVTNIEYEAFWDCSGLKSVTIGDGVSNIESYAFAWCTNLANVTIPDSVTSIGSGAFYKCADSLYDIVSIPGVQLVDGWAVGYTDALRGHLDLTSVRGIGANTFEDCTGLTSVTIPEGIVNIDWMVFRDCSGLTSVTIPKSVTNIGCGAFWGCPISKMIIPANVTSIGDCVFEDCGKLRSVTLPVWCKGIMIYDRNPSYLSEDKSPYILSHEPMPQFDRMSWNEYLGLKKSVKISYEDVEIGGTSGVGGTSVGGDAVLEMWKKAQTVDGVLYKGDALAGTVQVKVGKINKKGVVKVSAAATLLVDGKAKKVTAKAVNVALDATGADATGRVPPVSIVFKEPIGEMTFTMAADGTFTLKNGSYLMVAARIGGALKGGSSGTFRIDDFDLAVPGELLDGLLPFDEAFGVSGTKWQFAKAATVKWTKPKKGAEPPEIYDEESGKGLLVDDSKGKTNLSGLKLTYAAKTGQFKGSFKVYALQGNGKKTKLAKYTVNVIGFVVDGVGYGEASCKKPAGGPWAVTVE